MASRRRHARRPGGAERAPRLHRVADRALGLGQVDDRGSAREGPLQEGTRRRDPGVHERVRPVRATARARPRDPYGGSERRGERRADPRLPRAARARPARLSDRAGLLDADPPALVPYGTALMLKEWIVAPVRSRKSKRATAGSPGSTLIVTTLKRSRSNSLTWGMAPGISGRRPTIEGGSSRKIGSIPIAPATISGVKCVEPLSTRWGEMTMPCRSVDSQTTFLMLLFWMKSRISVRSAGQ